MPSFWTRTVGSNGARSRVPDQRSRSVDSRRAARLCSQVGHDHHDSNLTEISAVVRPKKNSRCRSRNDNVDTISIGDEIDYSRDEIDDSVGEIIKKAKTQNSYTDVKVLQYKAENVRLKELLRSRTHDLRETCSALSICQTELAEALIAQTADDSCAKGRQIHKLARDLKGRLCNSEMQMKLLREERDQGALDLTALSGKMTTCTTIAAEQAKLLKGQLDTIRKFEKKIQTLEQTLQEMRTGHKQTVHNFERGVQNMQVKHKERLQDYEKNMKDMAVIHKEEIQNLEHTMEDKGSGHQQEIQLLEKSMQDMRAGYKEERAALEEQLGLHQQRAALQDRKIRKYHYELDLTRSELSKGRAREAEMERQLHSQTTICQDTAKELCAATKEIDQLNNVSLELHDQEERTEQLWVDNARLVQLLAESDEYQNLYREMQVGKGLVFCPSYLNTSRFQSLAQRYGTGNSYGPINPKSERDNWIPAELYDLVMAFRKQHSLRLEIEDVQELLRIMSAYWRERHRKFAHRANVKNDKTIADLKRQLLQRLPYGQVVQTFQPRLAKKVVQPKTSKNASPATRGDSEIYFHPEEYSPSTQDVVGSYRPPAPRREIVDNDHSGPYKAREGFEIRNSPYSSRGPREVYTKHRAISPTGKGSRNAMRISTIPYNSWREVDLGTFATRRGENDVAVGDQEDFYANSAQIGRKNCGSDRRLGGIVREYHGYTQKERENRHRARSSRKQRDTIPAIDLDLEVVPTRPTKPKKGRLRDFASSGGPGFNQNSREKVSPGRIIASGPVDDDDDDDDDDDEDELTRNVTSSLETSLAERDPIPRRMMDAQAEGDPNPRRRMYAQAEQEDTLSSFSGSSSV